MANTLDSVLAALAPSSWWRLSEAAGDLIDSGTGGYDLAYHGAAGGNAIWQMPGLAEGSPRVYGAWCITGFGYGNLIPTAVEGYNGATWNTGGMGVFCHISSHALDQWPLVHIFDSSTSRRMGFRIQTDGSVRFEMQAGGTISVIAQSLPGAFPFGERVYLYGQQDGVTGAKIYVNGVDVTDTVITSGAGITANSSMADLFSLSGFTGSGSGIYCLNGSGTPNPNFRTAIVSMPHIFYNRTLTDTEILSIYNAAGYGSGHDDYLEYMIDRVGRAKLYHPGTPSYGVATGIIPLITNTAEGVGNPRLVGANPSAVQPDTLITATAYAKRQWNLIGADADAYLRNALGFIQTPLVDTTESGTEGTIHFTVTIQEIPLSGQRYYFTYVSGTSHIYIYMEPGVGTEGQLFFQIQIGGVIQWQGFTIDGITIGQTLAFWVVQDGTGFRFYRNGQDITSTFSILTNLDDSGWLGDIGTGSSPSNTVYKFVFDDFDKIAHQAFYLPTAWSASQVLEHWNAMNGTFPTGLPAPPANGYFNTLSGMGNGGQGPDWWWRMNVANGQIQDIGAAQDRPGPTPPPIQGDSIVAGGNPLYRVTGPLPGDGSSKAIYFDGLGDYFEIGVNGSSGQLVASSTGTIGFFFSRNALEDENIVFSIGDNAYSQFAQIGLNNDRVELIIQTSAGNRVTLTSSKTIGGSFASIVITSDGSTYRLYIDGVEDTGKTVVTTGAGANGDWFDLITANQTAVAARADSAFTTETTGRISELYLYDGEVLTATQIATLNEAAIQDGILGTPSQTAVVSFENVTFRNGAFADIRAETGGVTTQQQFVRVVDCKFLGGLQGGTTTQAQIAIFKGDVQAQFRGCSADLQATLNGFGRGGIIGSQINPAAIATKDGNIVVTDCDFRGIGYLSGSTFLAAVMARAGFGMRVEGSRFIDCNGVAVGWLADAQRVAVLENQIEGTLASLGAIHSAAGLNNRLGSRWMVAKNKVIGTVGDAINLVGVAASGGTNYARNIMVADNETDDGAVGRGIFVDQCGDLVIDGNNISQCTEGIRLGRITGAVVARRNQITENTLTGIICSEGTVQLAELTVDRNSINGGTSLGDGITLVNLQRFNLTNNVLSALDLGIQIGNIGVEGQIDGNTVRADVTTPFALLSPPITGLSIGTQAIEDLGNANAIDVVGVATITVQAHHHAVTNSGAAQNISTINGPAIDGWLLVLRRAPFSANMTFQDGVGNLQLGSDFLMDVDNDQLWLIRDGSNWLQLSRVEAL